MCKKNASCAPLDILARTLDPVVLRMHTLASGAEMNMNLTTLLPIATVFLLSLGLAVTRTGDVAPLEEDVRWMEP
jgi:hypothetical protein